MQAICETSSSQESLKVFGKLESLNARPADATMIEIRNAFDRVRDSKDWKAPISMAVDPAEWPVDLIAYSVYFYTSTTITVEPIQNSERVLVTADGYRNGEAY